MLHVRTFVISALVLFGHVEARAQEGLRIEPPVARARARDPLPEPIPAPPDDDFDVPDVSTTIAPDTPSIDRPKQSDLHAPISDDEKLGSLPGDLDVKDSKRPSRPERVERAIVDPPAPPRGPIGGFFSRIMGRRPPTPPPTPREEIVLPTGDPESAEVDRILADQAEQRIERDVLRAVGNRISSMNVRVVGRRAYVGVKATRFYLKRGVRRSIESLPSLKGLEPIVEVE